VDLRVVATQGDDLGVAISGWRLQSSEVRVATSRWRPQGGGDLRVATLG
jgi:hypothetical protein